MFNGEVSELEPKFFAVSAHRRGEYLSVDAQYFVAWFLPDFIEREDQPAQWEDGYRAGTLRVAFKPIPQEAQASITDYESAQAVYRTHQRQNGSSQDFPCRFWYEENVYASHNPLGLVWEVPAIDGWLQRTQSNLYGYPVVMAYQLEDGQESPFPDNTDFLGLFRESRVV